MKSRRAFSLIEVLMAIMVFSIACLPLYQLYFKTGISQQRMIRDFICVTNVAEKIVNRIDHQLEKKPKLLSPMQKDVTPQVLVGMQDEQDWNFLGQSFADDSGRQTLKFIPVIKTEAEFRGFSIDADAIPADQRNNNPALLKEVLETINKRSLALSVQSRWVDQGQMKHEFRLFHIRALKPEF